MSVAHLYAPESFIRATPQIRRAVVNGCGPSGWKAALIPDRVWGLHIAPVCDIHDWMYTLGETIAQKDEADRVFLNNMLRLIDAAGGPGWLKWLRRRRAHKYYLAVVCFGGPAYWTDKNPSETLHPVIAGYVEIAWPEMTPS